MGNIKNDKIQTTLRLNAAIYAKMVYISKVSRRSFTGQVELLCAACIKKFEAENGPIPESETQLDP